MTDVTHILEGLNEQQREAVIAPPGPLLITAGAGSGKTTVLVRRIAWLIEATRVSKHRIVAVTFTNKAAREMKSRVEHLLGVNAAPSQIATFHGFSNRFLRFHHNEAGLPRDFTIMDSDDQQSFINRLVKDSQLRIGEMSVREMQSFINRNKDNQIRAANCRPENSRQETLSGIYELYEKECNTRGLVDFAEILLRTVEVMQRNELVRDRMRERYQHILVDEFQDTNALQIEWLKLFCGKANNITAVGDEDQSIYGWRGAVAKNMLEFSHIFRNMKLIRLEQNYRSTQTILSAANAVISRNKDRFEKNLWTERESGNRVRLYDAWDFEDEAQFVAEIIGKHFESGIPYPSFAVLYRTNGQSRIFEQVLSSFCIPYRVYGGVRFYARLEVKHILAYLRLLDDPHSNEAFARIINSPPRGIGESAQAKIYQRARFANISYWDAATEIVEDTSEQTRIRTPLERFLNLIQEITSDCSGFTFPAIIKCAIKKSQLRDYYEKRDTEIDKVRVEFLDEMVNAGANFIRNRGIDDDMTAIAPFLDEVTLDAGDTHDDETGAVQLMTLHQAKGLEFPVVFLTGLDEMLLPHANSINSQFRKFGEGQDEVEEERRLCYVGMTRAQEHLYLTRAAKRLFQGNYQRYKASRFLWEIPKEYLERVSGSEKFDHREPDKTESVSTVHDEFNGMLGKTVRHPKFGDGIVTDTVVENSFSLIKVNFRLSGEKLLVWEQAKLKVINE